MKTIEQIRQELDSKIPRDAVMQREGSGGKSFSYLSAHYVIDRMNKIFGQGNWSYLTDEVRCVHAGQVEAYGKTNNTVHYIAKVTVQVKIGDLISTMSDVGYGDGSDKQNIGKAHELAVKESVSDALKRACKSLGMSMGLALYDKDQTNVDDGSGDNEAVSGNAGGAPQKAAAQGTPKAEPIGKAPPVQTAVQSGSVPEAPPEDRSQLNEMISKMAKVIVAKRVKTLTELKALMVESYGTDKKETLNEQQAKDLYGRLRAII